MPDAPSLLTRARSWLSGRTSAPPTVDLSRRHLLSRPHALGFAPPSDAEAWDEIEGRARELGIEPGTVVDARGRLVRRTPLGDEPYLGEIMLCGWNFAARGWALCDGQLFAIAQYDALYSLLGTTFGGDGRTSFGLPDLRSRSPMHMGQGAGLTDRRIGARAGTEQVTMTTATMPSHTHGIAVPASSDRGTARTPAGNILAAEGTGAPIYAPPSAANTTLGAPTLTFPVGSGIAMSNVSPFTTINAQIALVGIYPSRS